MLRGNGRREVRAQGEAVLAHSKHVVRTLIFLEAQAEGCLLHAIPVDPFLLIRVRERGFGKHWLVSAEQQCRLDQFGTITFGVALRLQTEEEGPRGGIWVDGC